MSISLKEIQAERTLQEYKDLKEQLSQLNKRACQLQKEIKETYEPGVYGSLILTKETRDVKEYVVAARTDIIIKVTSK